MSENPIRLVRHDTEGSIGADVTVVELRGEIDLRTAPALAARLDALTAGPRPDLVLDLRPVSFIDCSGLGVLCRTRNRVVTRCGRLRLVSGSTRFLRILRGAGLADVFEVLPVWPRCRPVHPMAAPLARPPADRASATV